MNNFGKLREVSNEGVDWMFPQFQEIKETSVSLTINEILQVRVGVVGVFKRSDVVGTLICSDSVDTIVLNPTLDVLYYITHDGFNLQGENYILIYLNVFKHFLYA